MEGKFGEWVRINSGDVFENFIGGRLIAFCTDAYEAGGMDLAEAQANAQLISAAPELLEACKSACGYYEKLERSTGIEHGVLIELRAAIKKAEGRT